jgi:hypothetical protein
VWQFVFSSLGLSMSDNQFPSASELMGSGESTNDPVLTSQRTVVCEHLKTLSRSIPSVTFDLDQPLLHQIKDELVVKGYCVTALSASVWSGGSVKTTNTVKVSLPVTYASFPYAYHRLLNVW